MPREDNISADPMHTTMDAFRRIQEQLVDAVCATFQEYGVKVAPTQDGAPAPVFGGRAVAGIMGYADERIRGCIVVAAAVEVLELAMPRELEEITDESLRDLAGELANMLAGRIKNRLLDGKTIQLACPVTAIGTDLALPAPAGGTSTWHAFTSKPGMVYVRLDAVFQRGFKFAPSPVQNALPEGELVLFELAK